MVEINYCEDPQDVILESFEIIGIQNYYGLALIY
mgnify:CR=1 FL=1